MPYVLMRVNRSVDRFMKLDSHQNVELARHR